MIHATESSLSHGASRSPRGSHSLQHNRAIRAGADLPGISPDFWPVLGFGHRPETNSLWDTHLLDRLSLPLSRYHE